MQFTNIQDLINQATNLEFQKSLENNIEKGMQPIGAITTHSDGKQYKKVAEGDWRPVSEKGMTKKEHISEMNAPGQMKHVGNYHKKVSNELSDESKDLDSNNKVMYGKSGAGKQEHSGKKKSSMGLTKEEHEYELKQPGLMKHVGKAHEKALKEFDN